MKKVADEFDPLDWFDFNDCGPSFAFLGGRAGKAVQRAAVSLESRPADPLSVADAVRGARLALPQLAHIARCDEAAKEALAAICNALERAESALRTDKPKRGRPTGEIDKQAAGVLAVYWLGRLRKGRLPQTKARQALATLIPKAMCQLTTNRNRPNTRQTPEEALKAWQDAFSRKENKSHQRTITEAYTGLMREMEEAGTDPRAAAIQDVKNWLLGVLAN